MRRLLCLVVACACGSPKPPPTPVGPPAAIEAQRASADDVIVARVNGRPVWGSCVAIQAKRTNVGRQAALQQCVDFELLAQTAEQRGFATHPDVAERTHAAMVSQLVAQVYEDGYTKPEQFGADWDALLKKNLWHVKHENYRGSSYVRINVDAKATPEQDRAAHALADQIAAALAPERGLMGPSLLALAQRVAGTTPLAHEDVQALRAGAFGDDNYANTLFTLPEVGRASGAVRTKWGWDIIVWTEDIPETSPSQDEIVALMLPDIKRLYFNRWLDQIAKSLGVHVELVPENVAKLEELP